MFAYKGSTAMITGASKGLGAAFAKELAGRGMNLVLIARSIDTLQDLADSLGAQYGVSCVALRADLAASDAVERIVTELERLDLKIDLLINNAGLGLTGDFLSHDLAQELASIQVNVQALVALSHAMGAKMVSRGTGGIINLASNAAFQPLPHMATYAAAKAFVLHFSEALKFGEDRTHAAHDPEYARRFWRILLQVDRVFKLFRTGFIGKCSPVHFFWGSFDLAVTRFSGRPAPVHPGGIPNLWDEVVREAYSHEVSSAGFWPGGGIIEYPAFYSYAYQLKLA